MSHGHDSSQHGAQNVSRRRFLGTAATAAAGAGLAVGTSGAAATDTYPRVTTRGHYDITWYGSVYLTDGHTAWDYDTAGDIPGVDSAAPDELLVHVHGWMNEPDSAIEGFQTAEESYRNNGYDGAVIGFSWDSDSSVFGWWDSTEIAESNGLKLANFVNNYRQANPDTTIRLVCHSLGARVTLRCIEVLNANGITDAVQSVSLLGGAADNDAVSTGGRYGPDLASAVGQVDNYWKDGDDVLNWAYTTAEFDSAVGEEGCEGTEPGNYQDHNVDYVPDHYSYYEPGEGCIGDVTAEW
jgi:pimeloyl-ACP methyl ester carboxylesterase